MLHRQPLATMHVWPFLLAFARPGLYHVRCAPWLVRPLLALPWPVLRDSLLVVCLPARLRTGLGWRKAWRLDARVLFASCLRALRLLLGGWLRDGLRCAALQHTPAPSSAWQRRTFRLVFPARPSSARFRLFPLLRSVRRRCV